MDDVIHSRVDEEIKTLKAALDISKKDLIAEHTARVRAESFAQNMLENSPEAMLIADKDGCVVYANCRLEELFGYAQGELQGEQVEKLIADQLRAKHRQIRTGYLANPKSLQMMGRGDLEGLRKDGSKIPLVISLVPIDTNTGKQVIATVHDVSRRKLAEQQLKDMNIELGERVRQRTLQLSETNRELVLARDKAERSNRAKSDFLSRMSHELRTPLNTIMGYSQLMCGDEYESGEEKSAFRTINSSAQYLLALISDLLDMAKIDSGALRVQLSNFCLMDLLESILEMFVPQLKGSGVSLVVEGLEQVPRIICADQRMLRQVLINLVGNAVKFTEIGTIRIVVSCDKLIEGKEVLYRFAVEDTGSGFQNTKSEELFRPFSQISSTQYEQHGAGLGLSICKHFVEEMGGNIGVDSKVGDGSTVKFSIRALIADNEISCKRKNKLRVSALSEDQKGYRILIVEDNATNRLILKKYLTRVGFDVELANNGKDAVEKWSKWKPDLIWMDIQMPVLDGLQATRAIRQQETDSHTVIIALTANVYQNDLNETIAAGCDDYATKPFNEAEIFTLMEKHLGVEYVYSGLEDG